MSAIPEAMSKGLKIRHNRACVGIKYTDTGVEVATREVNEVNSSWVSNNTNTITADAVLLTIPLGVLKKEKLKFEPPLPEWKTSAIKRMGFGNLNKVRILLFYIHNVHHLSDFISIIVFYHLFISHLLVIYPLSQIFLKMANFIHFSRRPVEHIVFYRICQLVYLRFP